MSAVETCPVPLFQHQAELDPLLAIYRDRAPRTVLEIGTYHGGTLWHWLTQAQPGAVVVSVDSYAVGVDNRPLYDEWCPPDVDLVVIEGNSHHTYTVDAVRGLAPYDWIFIDAGHYYHEVKTDWELYGPMASDRGLVIFHDILPPSANHPEIEVERLWRQIQRSGFLTREIVEDPFADWGGIGIVYPAGALCAC